MKINPPERINLKKLIRLKSREGEIFKNKLDKPNYRFAIFFSPDILGGNINSNHFFHHFSKTAMGA